MSNDAAHASLLPKGSRFSFCPSCGGKTEDRIPYGDNRIRTICTICACVHYQNPKMVVGCIVEHEGKILLCKRGIEPSYDRWTLPAGYMELGESAAEGAARETLEEANAEVEILLPFAHLDIPAIGLSFIIFRARFRKFHFSPGPESLDCALFDVREVPFESVAFSSIIVALKLYIEDLDAGDVKVHYAVLEKRPGSTPWDPEGFMVLNHISS